jgi:hypothetical protein
MPERHDRRHELQDPPRHPGAVEGDRADRRRLDDELARIPEKEAVRDAVPGLLR